MCTCVCVCVYACSAAKSYLTLCDSMDYKSHQAPLSMGFSRQEYWSDFPFPPPGDLPIWGIEPASPTLAGVFFTVAPPGSPACTYIYIYIDNYIY